ncbi:MAG: RNA methyltransferase, partial [Methanothrix sp.]|nr:RNA methyltransferase [Methanothrix sp.]
EKARSLLQEISYPEHKVEFSSLMLRRIFGRAELTERVARTLLGIIKNIRWKIGCGSDEKEVADNPSEE